MARTILSKKSVKTSVRTSAGTSIDDCRAAALCPWLAADANGVVAA